MALILIVIMVGISVGKVVMTRHEQNTALEKNRALKEKKKDLEKELKLVNEPEYIEEQARKQLKLVKPGEIIYIIDGDKKDKAKDLNEKSTWQEVTTGAEIYEPSTSPGAGSARNCR